MAEQKRDFKGVWIPKEIWLDENLNMLEKGIFAEIDSLDDEAGCYASNKHLADFCQCSETKVSTAITKLKNLGYIYEKSFDGRQRILKSRLSNFERQACKKLKADPQNLQGSTISNTVSNTVSNNNIYISEFDELWELYPRKKGKPIALKAYIKARKNGTTFEQVKQGVLNYRMQIEVKGTATEYIKHGSTWFNQEAWGDEYDLTQTRKNGAGQKDNVLEWLKEDYEFTKGLDDETE